MGNAKELLLLPQSSLALLLASDSHSEVHHPLLANVGVGAKIHGTDGRPTTPHLKLGKLRRRHEHV
jgi:hypothetical protein